MQFVHSKALSEVNGDLEDNGHRNGDSVRIGPAAKPSAIPKSKLKQVQSEVMSVMSLSRVMDSPVGREGH